MLAALLPVLGQYIGVLSQIVIEARLVTESLFSLLTDYENQTPPHSDIIIKSDSFLDSENTTSRASISSAPPVMASNSSDRAGSSKQSASEDWANIEDQHERRRVQNRIAQRTYRARKKNEAEETARIADNQQAAGAAYRAPDSEDMARNDNPNGLPWGSYSMKHAVEAGKAKQSQQGSSQDGSSPSSSGRR